MNLDGQVNKPAVSGGTMPMLDIRRDRDNITCVKLLRLQEARRLMLAEHLDAAARNNFV